MTTSTGHWHEEVATRLVTVGADIYLTDTTTTDDTVTMTSDCSTVTFDIPPTIGADSPPGPAPSP